MSKVQRVPRELLALLGIVGENAPSNLLDDYRGTIEMIDLILASIPTEEAFVNNAAAASGTNVDVIVPDGEVWFVRGAQVSINVDVSVQTCEAELIGPGGFLARQTWNTTTAVGGAVVLRTFGYVPSPIFIARAGQRFRGRMIRNPGFGLSMTTFVTFARVRV